MSDGELRRQQPVMEYTILSVGVPLYVHIYQVYIAGPPSVVLLVRPLPFLHFLGYVTLPSDDVI